MEKGFCKEGWHDFPWRRPFKNLSLVVRRGSYVEGIGLCYNPIGKENTKVEMCGSAIQNEGSGPNGLDGIDRCDIPIGEDDTGGSLVWVF